MPLFGRLNRRWPIVTLSLGLGLVAPATAQPDAVDPAARASVAGWLRWRGPGQDGRSSEVDLPEQLRVSGEGAELLWSLDLPGRGTPVVANGRVFTYGYVTQEGDILEALTCCDAATGKVLWQKLFLDFLSDNIYTRYGIGAPAVCPETGDVYLRTTPGVFSAYSADGELRWQRSLMEEFGQLTFPNGRTGAPVVEGDLVVVNVITSGWGGDGPARNRFLAFDKATGDHVWTSTPGDTPKDSSFSTPVALDLYGSRALIAGTGCGYVVCMNAFTGEPLWRVRISQVGVNGSPVITRHPTRGLVAIVCHAGENLDVSSNGGLYCVQIPTAEQVAARPAGQPLELKPEAIVWRHDAASFTSSPVEVSGVAYQLDESGQLHAVDVATGKANWVHRLGASNLHSSPLFADGRLYVPTWHDGLFVLRPGPKEPVILSHAKELQGDLLGSIAVWDGVMYVHSTEKLYAFGKPRGEGRPLPLGLPTVTPRAGARLEARPFELLLRPGDRLPLRLRGLCVSGRPATTRPAGEPDSETLINLTSTQAGERLKIEPYVPAVARVKSFLDVKPVGGELTVAADAKPSAGMFKLDLSFPDGGALTGYVRGRVLPRVPFSVDFEDTPLSDDGVGRGPLHWIGAGPKFDVRQDPLDMHGKVLAKTLGNVLFQRATVFMAHPDERGYTVQADVLTDGNRRQSNDVGVICQRYVVALKGNEKAIEVSSNHERLKVAAPYPFKPGAWHTLKARVDVLPDGTGVVRGKAWLTGAAEPDAWTIEVPVKHPHLHGSPGLYSFNPQDQLKSYIDNIKVFPTPAQPTDGKANPKEHR